MTDQCDTTRDAGPSWRARLAALWHGCRGATSLEYALLIGAIAIPTIWLIREALSALVGYYGMMASLNGLPFP